MPRLSRHPLIILLVLLALATAGFFWLRARPESNSKQAEAKPLPAAKPVVQTMVPPEAVVAEEKVPAASAPLPAGGKSQQQAYRFAIQGGKISLEGVELLQGDFHQRRGSQPWMPGMWCVRFLDANMRVLAQETTAAPDEPCVVLDPNVLNASGAPQASKLKLTDDVMMQMRVPPVSGASWIKIYRIAGTKPAGWDVEPLGQLLASIPLPP